MVKNLPAMQETQVRFLGWEDPLKKGMAAHSSILVWIIPWTKEPVGGTVHGVTKSLKRKIVNLIFTIITLSLKQRSATMLTVSPRGYKIISEI